LGGHRVAWSTETPLTTGAGLTAVMVAAAALSAGVGSASAKAAAALLTTTVPSATLQPSVAEIVAVPVARPAREPKAAAGPPAPVPEVRAGEKAVGVSSGGSWSEPSTDDAGTRPAFRTVRV